MKQDYDNFFRGNFNTALSPEEETQFQQWAQANGKDPYFESTDYDLRGFWKDKQAFAENGHGSDRYKKPNHPTFSDQSMYHNTPTPSGERYIGGSWETMPPAQGVLTETKMIFRPSHQMLDSTHPVELLRDYMDKYETGNMLLMPGEALPVVYDNGDPSLGGRSLGEMAQPGVSIELTMPTKSPKVKEEAPMRPTRPFERITSEDRTPVPQAMDALKEDLNNLSRQVPPVERITSENHTPAREPMKALQEDLNDFGSPLAPLEKITSENTRPVKDAMGDLKYDLNHDRLR